MTDDKRMFIRLISKVSNIDISYLECLSIQSVIDYKWNTYAVNFYWE